MSRLHVVVATGFAMLVFATPIPGHAAQPVRVDFTFDAIFPSGILTDLCGIPVFVHQAGGGTTTLFFDRSGTLVRELDTLAPGATTTIFSPVEEGGTGKSFTDVTHQPSIFSYPEGTALGAPVILTLYGVQRTSGPGNPRIVGRQVFEGIIIGYTDDGVPIADTVGLLAANGQFDIGAVLEARCSLLLNE